MDIIAILRFIKLIELVFRQMVPMSLPEGQFSMVSPMLHLLLFRGKVSWMFTDAVPGRKGTPAC